ncbi:MAG: serine/threonine protein kinase, partial [Acidobacteria bacterium]
MRWSASRRRCSVSADETRREELAGSILDGTPIDWDALQSEATPPDRPFFQQLRAIAAIADAQRSEAPPDTWGPLRLLERVGQGAFGDVYRAWDPRLDREVALKLMPADPDASGPLAASIIDEGRLLARVRHPNVVTIYGAERIDDRVGLWMEYVDGRTFHQLVTEDGRRFSPREVAALGETLCGAVEAVHGCGLLHRDIKAQNVMIAADGRVALMDFGAGGELRAQSAETMAGTPLYLAPEVLEGASAPTAAADVYSIGVLLFFLLTGTYPVLAKDLEGLRGAHALGDRRSLRELRPDVPGALARVVERAIEPDSGRRYPSAAALGAALRGAGSTRRHVVASALATAALALAFLAFYRPDAPSPIDATRPQIAVLPLANLTGDSNE